MNPPVMPRSIPFSSACAFLRLRIHGAHHARCISAVRSISQTSSSLWLCIRCSKVTIPASGRDLLSLRPITSVFGAQRVADEDRLGHPHLVVAEVGDQRAERRVADRQADQQARR